MYNADPTRFRPLSPRAYIGFGLLYFIPVIGLIFAIYFAVKSDNVNLRSYSRAFLISLAALIVLIAAGAMILFSQGRLIGVIRQIPQAIKVLFSSS